MVVLDGKKVAEAQNAKTRARADAFAKKNGRPPGLAVVIVGEDPASHVYVKNKVRACEKVGIRSFHLELDKNTSELELIEQIRKLNRDQNVDGILVQLPLPKHLDSEKVLGELNPAKDADGLTVTNLGLLFAGRPRVKPCTPRGVIEILKFYDIPIEGQSCLVIGRSQIVGRPMSQLLLLENGTVTVAHSKTKNLQELTRMADIVVAAAGRPRFLGAADFKKGAVVIDVGIHRQPDGLCGDVRYEELHSVVSAATPVPGGVGPMTISMLLANTVDLAEFSTST